MMDNRFFIPFTWVSYSKKLHGKIQQIRNAGHFSKEEAAARQMHLAIGKEQAPDGESVVFYLLIDETDGVIAEAKFQAFGSSVLIGAAEATCDLLLRKNYDQARRLSADLIDRGVRDRSEQMAFPEEASGYLNLILAAVEKAAEQCGDIPLPSSYVAPPSELYSEEMKEYPGWKELSTEQKINVIEQVIDKEIRPYIELDAGGIRILKLVEDKEVVIAYEGSCTSCYSSTGATLNAIQQILRSKVYPDIVVTPDLSFLQI